MGLADLDVFLEWFRDNAAGDLPTIAARCPSPGARDWVRGYADVFRALGLLHELSSGSWQVARPHAHAFFRSLHDMNARRNPILGPFPLGDDIEPGMTWMEIFAALERRRLPLVRDVLNMLPRDEWEGALERRVRMQSASILALVGHHSGEPHVLLEYDAKNWRRYRLVGGKRQRKGSGPETSAQTLVRELEEELDLNIDKVFSFGGPACVVPVLDLSRRLVDVAHYTFSVFRPTRIFERPICYDGTQKGDMWWLPLGEVLAAAERRDDRLFHDFIGNTLVLDLLRRQPVEYQLSPADVVRIRSFGGGALRPPNEHKKNGDSTLSRRWAVTFLTGEICPEVAPSAPRKRLGTRGGTTRGGLG